VPGALDGIRVCDLSQFEAGPSCTELLAFLGADVIKVEDPKRGDQGRLMGMGRGTDSMYFLLLNLNKRSITLNLKSEEGVALFKRMLPSFDVLVENFTLGTLDRLGLSWETLREIHPGLIYASVRGFGDSGSLSEFKSFDMVGQAAGGAMSVNGVVDGPPTRLGVTLGDTGTGVHLAVGILAAYVQKQRTGLGQRVELSMQEAVMNYTRVAMLSHYLSGEPTRRRGNPIKYMSGDLYRCAGDGPDDYAFMLAPNPAMWDGVLKTIDRTDLIGDEEWSNALWRAQNWDDVHALVESWTATRDKFTVAEAFQANGVPCSAVFDTGDLLSHEHLRGRGAVATVEHPDMGTFVVPGNPVRLQESPTEVTRSPLLGEHNTEVYDELLGLGGDELGRLRETGVI
jgi:formyl-CoA transferase